MYNQAEVKKILDQSMITRSIIESEVTMRKCLMYSEMAHDKEVKAFFAKQAAGLEGVADFLKIKYAEMM